MGAPAGERHLPRQRSRGTPRPRCAAGVSPDGERTLPPGQQGRDELPVRHYGPIPKNRNPQEWVMAFWGRTATPDAHHEISVAGLDSLPLIRVVADLHCAGGWSVRDNVWEGVAARDLLDLFPPVDD